MKWPVLLLLCVLSAAAQPAKSDAAKLQDMTSRMLAGDIGIDFRELRRLCMRVPACKPRSTEAELARMSKASPLEAIKIAESLLPSQIANAELYNTLALNYQRAGNKNQYERFNALGMQLMAPAVAGNDGKSPRTAFDVISDREMFYILTAKSLPYHGSAILGVDKTSEGGHKYHKWRIRDPKTGQTVAMYFNVDLFQPKSTAAK